MTSHEAEGPVVGPETTLAAVALRGDPYMALLDRYGFDFCRGAARTLGDACAAQGVALQSLLTEIEEVGTRASNDGSSPTPADWNQRPLAELIAFIVDTHHAFTRSTIARISRMLPKVVAKHGAQHPHLQSVAATFGELAMEMEPHMRREEMVLFPFIRELGSSPEGPVTPPFGTVRNPVRMMMREHDRAEELLASLYATTNGFQPPADACIAQKTVYAALAALRIDLLRHMSLENDLLFPRAMEAELQKLSRARAVTSAGTPTAP